ncbi:MAG: pectinesterase family protein [Acidobacteriaceae bacterium]
MLALACLIPATAFAADVIVRVDPKAPAASPGRPGSEAATVFPTIQNALDHHPFATGGGRVVIQIAPGTYRERIIITQNHPNITLLGMGSGPEETVITNSLNAKTAGGTFFTETVEVNGTGFEADNVTFENAAGNTGQAVAVANRSDRSVFKHCRLLGHQDTLFADYGRQYYVDSYIEGGVDYIFGNAAAVFERDELHSNGPGYITAQSRTSPDQPTGYVIVNSRVTAGLTAPETARAGATGVADSALKSIGLGRPWRAYGRTIFLNTALPAEVTPAGWNNWGVPANEATAYYAESGSTGPGAKTEARAPWAHHLSAAEAKVFLPQTFLKGLDHWDAVAEAARLP